MQIPHLSGPLALSAIPRAAPYWLLFAAACLFNLSTDPNAAAAVPTALAAPVLSASGCTGINVSWTPLSTPITHYSVRYRVSGQTWIMFSSNIPGTATTHVITGLTASTKYEVTVRPSTSEGNGAWSPAGVVKLPSGNPTLSTPLTTGDIIWQDLIDEAPEGTLTQATGDNIFSPTVASSSSSTYTNGSITNQAPEGKMLRHNIPANSLGAFIVTPRLSRETDWATLEYDIHFDTNFDWQWGGKLGPGLIGVAPGHDILEPTSCQARTGQSFSTRLMWHGNNTNGTGSGRPFSSKLPVIPAGGNDIVTYIYANYPYEGFGNCGWHSSMGPMSKGVWHTIKQETKLNTIGQRDGVFRVWIDGASRFEATNWSFRTTSDVRIQGVLWDIHRGGGLPQWGSPINCNVDIRNVVVRDLNP